MAPWLSSLLLACLSALLLLWGCGSVPPTATLGPSRAVADLSLDAPPVPVQSGELLFEDNFDGSQLDSSKWSPCYSWDWQGTGCTNSNNKELQWYLPSNITLGGGLLTLTARSQPITAPNGQSYAYTSGMISSHHKFNLFYGYVEIRAKVPAGYGLWPAFWLLPASGEWPPELDVLEVQSREPNRNYVASVFGTWWQPQRWQCSVAGPDFSQGFHTFAMSWQSSALIWYIDWGEICRTTNTNIIPNEPMYLVTNLASGGWAGDPNATTPFPAQMQVDYIRIWK